MLSLPSRVQAPAEMASTTILRKSVTSMVPLAVRAVQRNHLRPALFSALHLCSFSPKPSSSPFPSMLHCYYSRASELSTDDDLLRIIDSEIKSAEEADDLYEVRFFFFLFLVALKLKLKEILFSAFFNVVFEFLACGFVVLRICSRVFHLKVSKDKFRCIFFWKPGSPWFTLAAILLATKQLFLVYFPGRILGN